MGINRITHPDILRFIHAKNDQTSLNNFNISVTVTDRFMEAVRNKEWFQLSFDGKDWDKPIFDPLSNGDYQLYSQDSNNPNDAVSFTNKAEFDKWILENPIHIKIQPPSLGMVFAPDIWNRIVASAWKYAEPGIVFIDKVNRRYSLLNTRGEILTCNPCGEIFLSDNNACNLASIDLAKFLVKNQYGAYFLDKQALKQAIHLGVRFLDNVITAGTWPTQDIHDTVNATRPVGLGIMGFADVCISHKVKYGSEESIFLAKEIMNFMQIEGWKASANLAIEKGACPEYQANRDLFLNLFKNMPLNHAMPYPNLYLYFLEQFGSEKEIIVRNYQVTMIAPTGTISLVAETSSGIEPNFSYAYVRNDTVGKRYYAHPLALEYLKENKILLSTQGIYVNEDQELQNACECIVNNKHLLPDYFVDAHALTAREHILLLAAFQQFTDNSISKSVNGKSDDTIQDVADAYMLAYELDCKCVSYYRDGSREGQVLTAITATPETTPTNTDSGQSAIDNNIGVGSGSSLGIDMRQGDSIAVIVERSGSSSGHIDESRVADFNRQVEEAKRNLDTYNGHSSDPNAFLKQAMINKLEHKATLAVRPAILEGKTYRVPFNGDSIYVTVNTDETGAVVEVLVDESTGHYKTIGKLISKMLRSNPMMIDEVLHTLLHAKGDGSTSFNQKMCTSIEQIVAECIKMRRHETIKAEVDNKLSIVQAELEEIKAIQDDNNLTRAKAKCKIIIDKIKNKEISQDNGIRLIRHELSSVTGITDRGKDMIARELTRDLYFNDTLKNSYCPECHAVMLDGLKCKVCSECGYSKCG